MKAFLLLSLLLALAASARRKHQHHQERRGTKRYRSSQRSSDSDWAPLFSDEDVPLDIVSESEVSERVVSTPSEEEWLSSDPDYIDSQSERSRSPSRSPSPNKQPTNSPNYSSDEEVDPIVLPAEEVERDSEEEPEDTPALPPPNFSSFYEFLPYKDIKESIKFPQYTPEERVLLANQVHNIMQVYVNRDAKVEYYGPQYDPIPKIEEILKKADGLPDHAIHTQFSEIFRNLRDFHTNYILPAPYSCYTALWPIVFGLTDSDNLTDNPEVTVIGRISIPPVIALSPEVTEKVNPGDVLVSYNGKTFKQLYQEYAHFAGGANDFGGQRSVLNYITYRAGMMYTMPEETEAVYVLRRPNGEEYTVNAKIAVLANKLCILFANMKGEMLADYSPLSEVTDPSQPPPKPRTDVFKHPFMDKVNDVFIKALSYDPQPTQSDVLFFDKIEVNGYKLGIIQLTSFMPENYDVELCVLTFRDLLINELADTDGVVIDVRDNGGGIVTLADKLVQMFVPDYEPAGVRALVHDINRALFQQDRFNDEGWAQAFNETKEGDRYTKIIPFTTKDAANEFGQAYLKPVGVLINANCYSSCDIFASYMQDSHAGVIYGEDPQTGAGGANVVQHKNFFTKYLPEVFQNMPGGQDMRIGWRQAIRSGKNAGKLIEDHGVYADFVVRPLASEFAANATRTNQLEKIVEHLKQYGEQTGKAGRTFLTEGDLQVDANLGSPVVFKGIARGLSKLDLVLDGQVVSSTQLNDQAEESFELTSSDIPHESSFSKYTIVGYSKNELVLKTHRYVRWVPKNEDFLTLSQEAYYWNFEFNGFAARYNMGTNGDPKNGWNKVENQLVIGDGTGNYTSNLKAYASLFVNVPKTGEPAMYVNADYATEEKYDFFFILINGRPVFHGTGQGKVSQSFSLSKYLGEAVEINFLFVSDPAVEDGFGVKISTVSFSS